MGIATILIALIICPSAAGQLSAEQLVLVVVAMNIVRPRDSPLEIPKSAEYLSFPLNGLLVSERLCSSQLVGISGTKLTSASHR